MFNEVILMGRIALKETHHVDNGESMLVCIIPVSSHDDYGRPTQLDVAFRSRGQLAFQLFTECEIGEVVYVRGYLHKDPEDGLCVVAKSVVTNKGIFTQEEK